LKKLHYLSSKIPLREYAIVGLRSKSVDIVVWQLYFVNEVVAREHGEE
jgi:hypothetical protein